MFVSTLLTLNKYTTGKGSCDNLYNVLLIYNYSYVILLLCTIMYR